LAHPGNEIAVTSTLNVDNVHTLCKELALFSRISNLDRRTCVFEPVDRLCVIGA
jgi:hypothetical protein